MVILTIILVQVLCCLYQSPKHYIEIWHERPFSLQHLTTASVWLNPTTPSHLISDVTRSVLVDCMFMQGKPGVVSTSRAFQPISRIFPYPWLRVSGRYSHPKDMEALSYGYLTSHLYRPQKSKLYLLPSCTKNRPRKMATYERGLWPWDALSPGKANVVADALSRKAHCHCLSVEPYSDTLCNEMRKLNLEIIPQGTLNNISIEPTLHDEIITAQSRDKSFRIIKQKLSRGEKKYRCFQWLNIVQKSPGDSEGPWAPKTNPRWGTSFKILDSPR